MCPDTWKGRPTGDALHESDRRQAIGLVHILDASTDDLSCWPSCPVLDLRLVALASARRFYCSRGICASTLLRLDVELVA